ncbi:MAG: TetR/AcrR family transcriptional regulator [Campylobacterota bacterium]|nr:TetR/AcrR family transcriptional regulator [Campylobacterota bacterium]
MTKDNILKIATQEFSRLGYDGVSMNNLASELKLNKATIYYHFKDKKSLYQEVIKSTIKHNQTSAENLLITDIDIKDKFQQYIKILVEKFQKNPQIVSIVLREMANLGRNIENAIEEDIEKEMIPLVEILNQLDLKEKYKDMDFHLIKSLVMGTTLSYYSIQISNIELNGLKELNKDSDKIFDYISEFISNILLDALCRN